MEKRSVNLSAILGAVGAALGARGGWRGMEYKNTLQRLGNVGKGAKKGLFTGLDAAENLTGPYVSRVIAGQARRISSDPSRSDFVRGVARKVGAGRADLANKFQKYVNPSNPNGVADYGRKSTYQLFQALIPGADWIGAVLHRVDPRTRRSIVSPIFDAPPAKPDYTGQLNRLGDRVSDITRYIQGSRSF